VLLATALVVATVTVGACGSPLALPGSSWTVRSVDGQGVAADRAPTIEFGSDGTVHGTTGCNSYSGIVTIDGDRITFESMASTLIGCDDALGRQERSFVAALDGATDWMIGSDGDLTISGAGDVVATPSPARSS